MGSKRKTHEEFLEELKEKNKYVYDNYEIIGEYISAKKHIKIKDDYGILLGLPSSLLRGCIPSIRSAENRREYIISKITKLYGFDIDFSNLPEKPDFKTKYKFYCNIHNIYFYQTIDGLMQGGHGCKQCAIERFVDSNTTTEEEMIDRLYEIHGENIKYKSGYVNLSTKCYFYNKYGVSYSLPLNILKGQGINLRGAIDKTSYCINMAKEVHGDKYSYDKFVFTEARTKTLVYCNHCNKYFEICPNNLLYGKGCPICADITRIKARTNTIDEIIELAEQMHGKGRYSYNFEGYKNTNSKIEITCNECGNVFYQCVSNHIYTGNGCQTCNKTSKMEYRIKEFLDDNEINNSCQYKFDDCKDKRRLPFDFYLKDYNIAIEADGLQHYEPVEFFGGEAEFINRKRRDKIKDDYCKDNNIKLIRIPYWDFDNIEEILKRELNL